MGDMAIDKVVHAPVGGHGPVHIFEATDWTQEAINNNNKEDMELRGRLWC